MYRREFTKIAGAALLLRPLTAWARERISLIGCLGSGFPYRPDDSGWIGFHEGLADSGYFDGQNLAIDYRYSEGHDDHLPGLAAELLNRRVELIAASGNPAAALAAKAATATVPIVFFTGGDPISSGVVTNLSHPGENVTGVTLVAGDLNSKRLELLSELIPNSKVVAVLVNPNNRFINERLRVIEEAARIKSLQLHIVEVREAAEFGPALGALDRSQIGSVLVMADALFAGGNRQKLIEETAKHAVPAIYEFGDVPRLGGLISYGANFRASGRQQGQYVGRILKGEKPGDLPVQQPTKFDLVINLKTAKALGLTVPQLLLAQADEVIE
jgi:putative ABC transport system substrate-binding protein